MDIQGSGSFLNASVQSLDPLSLQFVDPLNPILPSSSFAEPVGEATTLDIQGWNLDVDGDGTVGALSDGIMAVRYLFGAAFPGDALTDGAISPGATRSTTQIRTHLGDLVSLTPALSTITIATPDGDSIFTQGEAYTLTWTDNISENVKIDLYQGDSLVQTLFASTPSDGGEIWTVPSYLFTISSVRRGSSLSNW